MTANHDRSVQGRRRAITSVDVADAAGVSQTTVSLVVSGKADGRISAETQRLVAETAAKLGYVPNMSARVLRGGTPQVIALAVPNVGHEYFGRVLLAAENEAREKSLAVIMLDNASDPEWIKRLIALDRTRILAGTIVYALDQAATNRLSGVIKDLVIIESGFPQGKPSIEIDIAGGMHQVVEHLYSQGHRRIGHARADLPRQTFRLRSEHLQAALASKGITYDTAWQYVARLEMEEATARAVDFLRQSDVTAVFCDDDILAASIYRACRKLGITIPGELSVVGFNDVDLARYLDPELTSVAIPAAELGKRAVQMLIASITGASVDTPVLFHLHLQIRRSTAAPAGPESVVKPRGHGVPPPTTIQRSRSRPGRAGVLADRSR